MIDAKHGISSFSLENHIHTEIALFYVNLGETDGMQKLIEQG